MTRPGGAAGPVPRLLLGALRVFGLPVLLVALWWTLSALAPSFFLPRPPEVARAFAQTWFGARLFADVLPSLVRLGLGYAAAVVLGVGIGVPIGLSPRLRATCEPALEFCRAVPPPVLVPLIMLLAGISTTMKIAVIVSGCLWPILLNTVEGVRAVDQVLSDTCRLYGITGPSRLWHLVLRSASPRIMAGMRQALSIGIILMVISEMFASSSGLGHTIVQFQRGFAIPEMWSGIVLLGLVGFGLSAAFRLAEDRVLFWYHGQRRTSRGAGGTRGGRPS